MTLRILIRCWLLILTFSVQASDQQRELDYANDLQRTISTGTVVWLMSEGQRFLGLLTEAERSDNRNAVLVLPDMGEHPDQRPLIHGLRTVLPQHDWMTLAIQLPLREVGASAEEYYGLFDQAKSRIQSAVEFLRDKGAENIAVVGVGMGGAMALYTLNGDPNALFALVTISLPVPDSSLPQTKIGDFMKEFALPFLDIYAEFDLPDVADTAHQRRMYSKDNPGYRQIKINNESHAYRYNSNLAIKRIYSWLAGHLTSN